MSCIIYIREGEIEIEFVPVPGQLHRLGRVLTWVINPLVPQVDHKAIQFRLGVDVSQSLSPKS
jgi:hypothetical protein